MIIGKCGKYERFVVYWLPGEWITVPAVNSTICTDTRDKAEALEICRRNLFNFVEA